MLVMRHGPDLDFKSSPRMNNSDIAKKMNTNDMYIRFYLRQYYEKHDIDIKKYTGDRVVWQKSEPKNESKNE